MSAFRPRFSWLLLITLLMPAFLGAQTSRPIAESQADQAVEGLALRSSDSDSKPAALRTNAGSSINSNVSDLMRIVFALAIVIGIILILRTVIRRFTSLPGGARVGKLVTVLSRSMISPRQQILVLQVGKRLLVVGDSGGHMSQLCELTDPDEIAALIGQTRQAHDAGDRKARSFGNLFRRAAEPFTATQDPTDEMTKDDPSPDPVSVEEVGGLLEKIKLLQQQYKLKSSA